MRSTVAIVLAPVAGGTAVAPPPVNTTNPPPNLRRRISRRLQATQPPPPPPQDTGRSFLIGAHLALNVPFGDLPVANGDVLQTSGVGDNIGSGYGIGLDGGFPIGKILLSWA